MVSRFYGYYSSYDQTKNFTTTEQYDLLFPPTLIYEGLTYRYIRAYQVDTPSQLVSFEKFVKGQGCEVDVEIKQ